MSIPLKFVLVEDNIADQEILARHLAKAGIDCIIRRVETEPTFIAALKEMQPDLIISDFSLPQFAGSKALDIALAQAPATPFIYVSGTIGEEKAVGALRRGATDYVLKSNLSRLPSAVERALREAELKLERTRAEEQRCEQEMRLRRLTRTYRMLSSTTSAILRLRDRTELLDEVCRIVVNQGGYERVVLTLDDAGKQIRCDLASAATDRKSSLAPIDFMAIHSDPVMAQRSIGAGSPVIDNDLAGDRVSHAEYKELRALGYRAAAALPLVIEGATIGALTLFSSQRNIFDGAEVGVLLELAANLSFALQYFEKDEAVHFLSHYDSLTGLAKRKLFCQRLAQLIKSDAPGGVGRTVVVFDVQKLGAINDSFGRYVGDRLIETIAARLKQAYPDSASGGYFGGGTFALTLISAQSSEDTGRVLRSAAGQLFAEPFNIDGQELRPSIRSGVALYPHDAASAEALVQNAEAALQAAREDNEKCMLYGFVTRRPTGSLALETRLSAALDKQEFLLHYQPKIDIESGCIIGLEALLRWRDSELGLVAPGVFVPLLEQSGAIVDVGEWVLQQAARDMQGWVAAGHPAVRVAVNVSPLQLRRRDFVERFLASVGTRDQGRVDVDIEITESMLMQDLELSVRKLTELREAGVGVAIDDFGTGYSSLRLLAKLPVDTLKIDRTFVQSIADTPNVLTLVSTIVSLARAFRMKTVAEGVETAQQLQMLRLIKCDQAQGFLFGRPAPAAEIQAVIARLSKAN
jgi:diguanylate cyclase (GGDEF)-like protein